MSFSLEVKKEIVSKDFSSELGIPFLVGVIKYNAKINLSKQYFKLSSIDETIINSLLKIINKNTNLNTSISTVTFTEKRNYLIYELKITNNIEQFLRINNIYNIEKKQKIIPFSYSNYKKNVDSIRAYIAGVFLACGSVNSPQTTNYHLEMQFSELESALYIQTLINKYKFEFKYTLRKKKYVIYLKKNQMIFDFLCFISATTISYKFFNEIVDRDLKNSENRLVNIANSNYKKINIARQKDAKNIQKIKQNGHYITLSSKAKTLCELRLQNNDKSLNDLVKEMNIKGYKITKSGINTILREIAIKAKDN